MSSTNLLARDTPDSDTGFRVGSAYQRRTIVAAYSRGRQPEGTEGILAHKLPMLLVALTTAWACGGTEEGARPRDAGDGNCGMILTQQFPCLLTDVTGCWPTLVETSWLPDAEPNWEHQRPIL